MRYIAVLLLSAFMANAQINKEQLDLMPWPKSINLTNGTFALSKKFKVNITGNPNQRIFIGATNFIKRLDNRTGLFLEQNFITKANEIPDAELQINCNSSGKIEINQDESYELTITSNKITINAANDLGALHGLQTLLQLLQNNSSSYFFPNTKIIDSPRFTWRGLLIDAARHFQPVDVIKRNLDAMASMKMNVFHWHLADDQGWRIEVKKLPKLNDLGSNGNYYSQEQIKEVVKYASDRGIQVIPEIDIPGHASALLAAYPEIGSKVDNGVGSYSIATNSGIYNSALDPTNPKTYIILAAIFDEVCPLFPSNYFHIGGDENNGKEWAANPKIQEFMKKNNLVNKHDLQTYFNMKLIPMLEVHNKKLMGWEEIMTENMSKDAIIHAWRGTNEGLKPGESLIQAAKKGYNAVLSNGFYIDLMLPIETHYLNDPLANNTSLSPEEKARILGGEAAMWSELVTPLTIDSRIWPRTAAIAERLWSNENITDMNSLRKRLKTISFRLEELGITHIRNKEVILRNITNNQNTSAVNDFSNICEPLKNYKRNGGGKKYRMHSPLTLFADACNSDASDAFDFKVAVANYSENKNQENQIILASFFRKWIIMNTELIALSRNAPLIQQFLPLSKGLSDLSEQIVLILDEKQTPDKDKLNTLLEQATVRSDADVELAVLKDIKKLLESRF